MKELLIKRSLVLFFFIALLLIGLNVFKDYGVHYDEYINQSFGNQNLQCIINVGKYHSLSQTGPLAQQNHYLIHGPLIETLLSTLQRSLNLACSREILFMRHLGCFLIFFLGVIFFYLLGNIYFHNWKLSLIGCLFLVLSPRIFANAFYDTVDVPFLSFYIMSMYTLLRLVRHKTVLNLLFHTLACAFLITTRQVGLIMPAITFLPFFLDMFKYPAFKTKIKTAIQFSFYMAVLMILTIIFWPILWCHPYFNFKNVLNAIFHLYNPITVLYLGQWMPREDVPWHYTLVWILITTPLLYCFYFLIGFVISIKLILKNSSGIIRRNSILMMLCFLAPLVLSKGKVYDGWRVLFFIYPAFLIFSLAGLSALWQSKLRALILVLTILTLISTGYDMVKNHPFENVYFNGLAGKDMQEVKTRFDLDYWGLSYKQGLEYILKTDKDKIILVATDPDTPYIQNNLNILPDRDKERLREVPLEEATYFLTNYRGHPQEYPYPEYYSIKIGDAKIMGVYKLLKT